MADNSRVAELEKENASLRLQLEHARKASRSVDNHYSSGFVTPLGLDVSASRTTNLQPNRALNQQSELAAECERLRTLNESLEARFLQLEKKHAKCKPYIEDAFRKYAAAKQSVRQWRAYIDRKNETPSTPASGRQDGQHSEAPKKEDIADLDATPRPTNVRNLRPGATDHNPTREIGLVPPALPYLSSLPAEKYHPHRSSNDSNSNDKIRRISSSQSTAEDSNKSNGTPSPPGLNRASSGSEPTVVSTRVVKRKRGNSERAMPPPVRIKREPESPDAAIELLSSGQDSPTDERPRAARRETSDLDALVATMKTPRTNRRTRLLEKRASSEELPAPPLILHTTSSLSEGDVQDVRNDENVYIKAEALDPLGVAPDHKERALSSLSVNLPTKSKNKVSNSASKRKSEDSADKIGILSEDGDPGQTQETVEKAAKTPLDQRLLSLLAEPSPENHVVLKRRVPGTTNQSTKKPQTPLYNKQSRTKAPSPTRAKPTPGKLPITPLSHRSGTTKTRPALSTAQNRTHRPIAMTASPPPPRPEDEPLRLRPMGSLHLDDFKVNPKYMNSDYAFADTLRRRDDRRCMGGCTKPECCGNAFLKAVEMGGLPASSKTDAEVLEGYLGPDWEQLIGAYAQDKRKDLLMQARAHAFANQFGKHRQAFERRSTPPGFWRTDMPTTQEEEDDRAKAREMVKAKVEERWREAMREGGRWLFRDE